MSGLKEKLLADMKQALKDKDSTKKDVVQIIRAGVLQIEKDNLTELDDSGVIDVISKEIKKRLDVLPDFERGGRQDLIDQTNAMLTILRSYLPEQLSLEALSTLVDEAIQKINASSVKDMGKIMQELAPKVKGRADNKVLSDIIKSKLQ